MPGELQHSTSTCIRLSHQVNFKAPLLVLLHHLWIASPEEICFDAVGGRMALSDRSRRHQSGQQHLFSALIVIKDVELLNYDPHSLRSSCAAAGRIDTVITIIIETAKT